ncbi:carbon monoxide dehydrogenase subunit G [Streptomyces sp. CA-111067]|uniref:carbon monoxide dehydrogenase subunit G n=1 Tax=Streptomyces sp. CA-111067 TaxID=3240046 RepID=UPI003D98EA9D
MEHDSFVPATSPAHLSRALAHPAVVAASLPGWQPDAPDAPDTPAPEGRLRLRIGGSTITYRGSYRVSDKSGDAGRFTVEATGTEVRGTGKVTATLEITLAEATHPEPGTLLTFRGTAQADGRLAGYDAAVVESAVHRLLDRFAAELAANAGDVPAAETAREPEPENDVVDDLGEPAPPADLDDFELVEVEVEVPESAAALDDLVPAAEAAHARRTMIGRSAEEVDHAPPRGRYAPVPAPESGSAAATLRWAAPAAAALVASAVVVGRVLRRRR